jgi:hypothetical protein
MGIGYDGSAGADTIGRAGWETLVMPEVVLKACEARITHEEDRLAFWKDEKLNAEAILKQKGIEFREMPVTGGNRMQLHIDPARQARVDECASKIHEHEHYLEEFQAYAAFLRLHIGPDPATLKHAGELLAPATARALSLSPHDVRYFGIKP